jgi:hypothetical protein
LEQLFLGLEDVGGGTVKENGVSDRQSQNDCDEKPCREAHDNQHQDVTNNMLSAVEDAVKDTGVCHPTPPVRGWLICVSLVDKYKWRSFLITTTAGTLVQSGLLEQYIFLLVMCAELLDGLVEDGQAEERD